MCSEPATSAQTLERVRAIVTRCLRDYNVSVYLFGSYARRMMRRGSDIDVAIDPLEQLPVDVLPRLRETLEESTIPQRVDLIDLSETSPAFRDAVRQQGIKWSG